MISINKKFDCLIRFYFYSVTACDTFQRAYSFVLPSPSADSSLGLIYSPVHWIHNSLIGKPKAELTQHDVSFKMLQDLAYI